MTRGRGRIRISRCLGLGPVRATSRGRIRISRRLGHGFLDRTGRQRRCCFGSIGLIDVALQQRQRQQRQLLLGRSLGFGFLGLFFNDNAGGGIFCWDVFPPDDNNDNDTADDETLVVDDEMVSGSTAG